MLGAAAINAIFTLGSLILVMVIGIVATYPDVSTWPLIFITAAVAVAVSILGYPFSYTTWLAVDLAMHPLEPEEIADARLHVGDSVQAQ